MSLAEHVNKLLEPTYDAKTLPLKTEQQLTQAYKQTLASIQDTMKKLYERKP